QALDRPARLLLDRPGAHVALLVLGDLPGDEDVVAGADRRVERQVGILLADGFDAVAQGAPPDHMTDVSMMSTPRWRSIRESRPRSPIVTSLDEARSQPAGGSGSKQPTSRGWKGSAISTRRSPLANQANGMTVPRKRSEGWWQPIIGGCGAPSGSSPSTWKVAIGVGHCSLVMS